MLLLELFYWLPLSTGFISPEHTYLPHQNQVFRLPKVASTEDFRLILCVMNTHENLAALANTLASLSVTAENVIVTAESCTGGWLAKVLTDIPGSSAWFDRGFITYTNEAKQEMLGVRADTLAINGAVSEQTVREMAQGAVKKSRGNVAVAISGIAGPGGAMPDKPLGSVWFAWIQRSGEKKTCCKHFKGNRNDIRHQAVAFALRGLIDIL